MSTNYVQKATGASPTGLTDSLVFDNGTNVGVGTSSPSYLLDVNGTAHVHTQLTIDNTLVGANSVSKFVAGQYGSSSPSGAPITYWDKSVVNEGGLAFGIFYANAPGPTNSNVTGYGGANGLFGEVIYLESNSSIDSHVGLWCYNPTVNVVSGYDRGASIFEGDLENGAGAPSIVPFTSYPDSSHLSKTGITSVLGPSSNDATAAFASTVNFAANNHAWLYGYWAGGAKTASFHADRWASYGNWDPTSAFEDATNATYSINIAGNPGMVMNAPSVHFYNTTSDPSTPADGLTITKNTRGQISSASDGVFSVFYTGASGTNTAVAFYRGTTLEGSITATTGSVAYNTSSDARLKQNVVDLIDALEFVRKLRPVTFEFTAAPGVSRQGFLAQEVQSVMPEIVSEFQDVLQLDYSKIVPVLVGAVKALDVRLTALEDKRQGT
jgi:hypothetical protein